MASPGEGPEMTPENIAWLEAHGWRRSDDAADGTEADPSISGESPELCVPSVGLGVTTRRRVAVEGVPEPRPATAAAYRLRSGPAALSQRSYSDSVIFPSQGRAPPRRRAPTPRRGFSRYSHSSTLGIRPRAA